MTSALPILNIGNYFPRAPAPRHAASRATLGASLNPFDCCGEHDVLLLEMDRLEGALGMREAIDLLETAARHEDAGATVVSPRLNTNFDGGWMRILFAVDKASGYFATKSYHLIQGSGVRYVVSLYALKDGALIAMIDGRAITDLRTGAASGVVAR
ncbi:MAG: hypothetical protein EBT83_11990, partial [Betaproteobacteria bacterium]|nr:hypothetical protein [Betaproteobacteria bacterium]